MAELSIQQLNNVKIALLVLCPIQLTAWVLVCVLWTNVTIMIIFGIVYVALFTALSVVSVKLRRRQRQAARMTLNAAAVRRINVLAPAAAGAPAVMVHSRGVYIIGDQTAVAVTNQTRPFSQNNTTGWREDDPPPPYSELPPTAQHHGVIAGQQSAAGPQPTSVSNQNDYWTAGGAHWDGGIQPPRGRGGPKPIDPPARW